MKDFLKKIIGMGYVTKIFLSQNYSALYTDNKTMRNYFALGDRETKRQSVS